MKTTSLKPAEVDKKWIVIDAEGLVVGRLASIVAMRLRGKHKPAYTPHIDCGDNVIVINAEKVKFTGNKWESQTYAAYSHYPGGLRVVTAKQMLEKHPESILINAVRRMVPRNPLGRQQMTKLKVYAGPKHDHQAQQPVEFKLEKK